MEVIESNGINVRLDIVVNLQEGSLGGALWHILVSGRLLLLSAGLIDIRDVADNCDCIFNKPN